MDGIGADELGRMQDLARRVWPLGRRWAPGELAWAVLTQPSAGEVAFTDRGFCWRNGGEATVVADRDDARDCLGLAGSAPVHVDLRDRALLDAVTERGYLERAGAPYELDLRRAAAAVRAVPVPDEYLVRGARADDDLVGVHRASWHPADLPFAPGHAPPVDPGATSSFTCERLAAVQADPGYDLDLHLVAEAPDGEPAASCIVWFDTSTGAAAIEPLGVVPEHRNHGLARALCLHAVAVVHARGGREVVIHPRGDAAYPAPRAAYLGAGFVEVGRTTSYALP